MKTLFDATTMGGLSLKNRLVRSATGDGLATPEGRMTPEVMQLYENLAAGGVGMIILGFTGVAEEDPTAERAMRLSNDALISDYARLAALIHRYDAVVLPQLALGVYVRQGSVRSRVGVNEMTEQDIACVETLFIEAAVRAKKAGFDGVQLHGCHKMLLSDFLRPKRNHRIDDYGGSSERRAKIVVDIIQGIHARLGDFHVSIKLNNTDIPMDECLETCKILETAGLDSLEMEWLYPQLHEAMQQTLSLPIILTGEHRMPSEMETLMKEGVSDYFGLSRPLIREPDLPKRWQAGDRQSARCISCDRCLLQLGSGCVYKTKL